MCLYVSILIVTSTLSLKRALPSYMLVCQHHGSRAVRFRGGGFRYLRAGALFCFSFGQIIRMSAPLTLRADYFPTFS